MNLVNEPVVILFNVNITMVQQRAQNVYACISGGLHEVVKLLLNINV